MVAASFNSGLYQAVLVVHLASAVLGFGASALGSVMLRRAWADGADAAAAVRRAFEFASNRLTDLASYVAGIAGFVAVLLDDRWNLRQFWVNAAFVLYFAWLAIAHGAMRPTGAKLEAALDEAAGSEEMPEAARALRRRLDILAALSNLVIVAVIAVMVTKPWL